MCVLFAVLSMTATKTYNDTFDNMLLKCPALLSLSYQKRHTRLPCPSACLLNIDGVVSLSLRLSEMGDSAADAPPWMNQPLHAALEVVSTQIKVISMFHPRQTTTPVSSRVSTVFTPTKDWTTAVAPRFLL
jgi:hypothetical protein